MELVGPAFAGHHRLDRTVSAIIDGVGIGLNADLLQRILGAKKERRLLDGKIDIRADETISSPCALNTDGYPGRTSPGYGKT